MGNASSNGTGGGCTGPGERGNNDPIDDSKYIDVAIGGRFTHPGYCDYCTTGNANCTTDEFMPDGNGDGKCRCRGFCNDACCRKACKRVKFNGGAKECCSSLKPWLGKGQTCDPKFRSYNTDACNEPMQEYCKEDNNFFTNPNCRAWYNKHPDAGTSVLLDVCRRPENIDKPECGCIKAADEIRTKFKDSSKVAVECIDNRCVNNPNAYKTHQMLQNPCNVVNCEMNFDDLKLIVNGNNTTYSPQFVQNCKSEYNKQETANAAKQTKNNTPDISGPGKDTVTNTNPNGNTSNPQNNTNNNRDNKDDKDDKASSIAEKLKNPLVLGGIAGGILLIIIIIIIIIMMSSRRR
jgi:hypothetical protein